MAKDITRRIQVRLGHLMVFGRASGRNFQEKLL